MSNCLGLFYAERLGNCVQYIYILHGKKMIGWIRCGKVYIDIYTIMCVFAALTSTVVGGGKKKQKNWAIIFVV